MKPVLLFLLTSLFLCCKQQSSTVNQISLKDSVVREYLATIDSMEFYDTFNRDFRILKAYLKNDTTFFSKLTDEMEQYRLDADFIAPMDSCVRQKRLADLHVDKAYRFKHREAFCFFQQNITITLSGNNVNLHYIEYSSNLGGESLFMIRSPGDSIKINPYCTIVKEFDTTLSKANWEELERKVREADYWGMKEKGGGGLDGSVWQIDAFAEHKFAGWTEKVSHSVWRHSTFSNGFKDLGLFILSLSGEKTLCNSFF